MTTAGLLPRQECAVMVLGGPTAVIDIGGLRIVTDPTFDAAGPHGYLTKTAGPAVGANELGPVDLVLVGHDLHPDNLDEHGRAFALAAPLVLTGPRSASRLVPPAVGLPLDEPCPTARERQRRSDRALSGRATRARTRRVIRERAKVPIPRLPVAFRPVGHSLLGSSFSRRGVQLSSRSAYQERPGPRRGFHVPHQEDAAREGALSTPGPAVSAPSDEIPRSRFAPSNTRVLRLPFACHRTASISRGGACQVK